MSPQPAGVLDAPVAPVLDLAGLGAPARPQVNLLPPEVNSRRALGKVKVRLVLVLVLVLLASVMSVAYAIWGQITAAADLALKQTEVQRLQGEQAQYAEVPAIKNEISRIEQARTYGMSTEVLWADHVDAIRAVTPQGVTIQALNTDLVYPGIQAPASANPLDPGSAGNISFLARATTLPNIGAWVDALDAIPGLSGAVFSTATITGGVDGLTYYDFSVTIQVDTSAFAERYAEPVESAEGSGN
ncbi:MAG TPA: fimbrial assembly protein [Actinotalea sp.]|nr:fimbrial assembly protein [Actinotalea sp.]